MHDLRGGRERGGQPRVRRKTRTRTRNKRITRKLVQRPNEGGICPTNALPCKFKTARLSQLENVDGISPDRRLNGRQKTMSEEKVAIERELKLPVNALEAKLSSWRLDTPPRLSRLDSLPRINPTSPLSVLWVSFKPTNRPSAITIPSQLWALLFLSPAAQPGPWYFHDGPSILS